MCCCASTMPRARDGHDQHRHHVALFVLERDRGGVEAIFAAACRIDDAAHLLAGFARGVNESLIVAAAGQATAGPKKPRRDRRQRTHWKGRRRPRFAVVANAGIAVKADLHARRDREIGEKALIEPLAANQPDSRCRQWRAPRTGRERSSSSGRSSRFRKGAAVALASRGFGIAEPRRPLRGARQYCRQAPQSQGSRAVRPAPSPAPLSR